MLCKEISDPRFGTYFVNFTNRVRRSDLKTLAESDVHEVVSDIREIASDFSVLEPHLFLVSGVAKPIRNLVLAPIILTTKSYISFGSSNYFGQSILTRCSDMQNNTFLSRGTLFAKKLQCFIVFINCESVERYTFLVSRTRCLFAKRCSV